MAVDITLTDSSVSGDNTATYTFTSQSFGTAVADRKIAIGVMVRHGSATVDSVTAGGVSLTQIISLANSVNKCEIWIGDVPTGTTGSVVVSMSASADRCSIGVHRLTGALDSADDTASSTADPLVASINCPAGGAILGVARSGLSATYSWTNLTERYDEVVEGARTHTGANDNFATQQTSRSITCTQTASEIPIMVLASFGPVAAGQLNLVMAPYIST